MAGAGLLLVSGVIALGRPVGIPVAVVVWLEPETEAALVVGCTIMVVGSHCCELTVLEAEVLLTTVVATTLPGTVLEAPLVMALPLATVVEAALVSVLLPDRVTGTDD